MKNSGKIQSKAQKIILSGEDFTMAYSAMLILFFVPYCIEHGGIVALSLMPVACLMPFAVVPLIYGLVHKVSPLLFGRYHLWMMLSAFMTALFFVVGFAADGTDSPASICLVFFGMLAFMTMLTVNRYCVFSVRARLIGESVERPTALSACFTALGAAAAIVTLYGFYVYDAATMYLNSAYVIAGVCTLVAVVQYFVTCSDIPRLGGGAARPVKNAYRALYGGIKKRTFFSSMFFLAAFMTEAVALVAVVVSSIGYAEYMWLVTPVSLVAGYAAVAAVAYTRINRRSPALSVAVLVCLLIPSGALAAYAFVGSVIPVYCLPIAAAVTGAGGALAMRQTNMRLLSVKRDITSGIAYILYRLIILAAVAVAFELATASVAVFPYLNVTAYSISFIAAATLAIVGFAIAGRTRSYPPKVNEDGAEGSDDIVRATAEENG